MPDDRTSQRRRRSPEDRRNELLLLGAEMFGQRPYDEVRIDEVAEKAGVSRALMYHYFPDKRSFFTAVVKTEGDRLFDATSMPRRPGQTHIEHVREGVLSLLRYLETHPHSAAWAAYISIGRADPMVRGLGPEEDDRYVGRIVEGVVRYIGDTVSDDVRGTLRAVAFGWLAFTFEICHQRVLDPTLDAETLADSCAWALLDALRRVPGLPDLPG